MASASLTSSQRGLKRSRVRDKNQAKPRRDRDEELTSEDSESEDYARHSTKRRQQRGGADTENRYDDGNGSSSSEGEGEGDEGGENFQKTKRETPEQKRLRLAKAYLRSMELEKVGRGEVEGSEEEGEDEEEGGGLKQERDSNERLTDSLSERIKKDALEQRGHYQRKIADKLQSDLIFGGGESEGGERCLRLVSRPMYGGGGGFHRKSLTGVAIPCNEGTKCYTVSKCGSLLGWDLEVMKRNNTFTKSVRDELQFVDSRSTSSDMATTSGKNSSRSREPLYSVCTSDDGRLVVTGGHSGLIKVWDARLGKCVKNFDNGHKDCVTGLTFQKGTMQLFSCSRDRTVKMWSLDDMAYIDTLFGHVQGCTQVDCLRKERVITVGEDRTCRLWKVQDETQLLFKGATGSGNIDACCFVNGTTFVTGSQDNSISLWSMFKKRPVYTYRDAHPVVSIAAEDEYGEASCSSNPCKGWIHSLAACANTDLVASGSGNGKINLYKMDPEEKAAADRAKPVCEIAGVEGYVNGLAFNNDATILVAAVGQEPRMGRWDRNKQSRNALYVQKLSYNED